MLDTVILHVVEKVLDAGATKRVRSLAKERSMSFIVMRRTIAEVSGSTITAELDSADNLKEVSATRTVTIGDRDIDLKPSFLVKAQTARVKLMSAFGNDKVSATVDYETKDSELGAIELGYERELEAGRTLTATLTPADKNLEVEVEDTKFESGATWTVKASVPLEGDNLIDDAKVSLTRAWSW